MHQDLIFVSAPNAVALSRLTPTTISTFPIGPGLRKFQPEQPNAGQTCSREVSRSQHRPSRITPPKLKVPGHSDPVKRWNFHKADFCLLLNPLRDCHLQIQQTSRVHTKNFVCPLYNRRETHLHSCRTNQPTTDQLLPQEQAGFRHGWTTIDQDTLLTQDMEDSFSAKKAGAVFVDLTAAYDTVWHRIVVSLTSCCDCYLIDTWSTRSCIWLAIAASPLPQEMANGAGYDALRTASHGSVLAFLLFNIYISDLPTIVSRKYAYTDNLAIMHADGDWQAVEAGRGAEQGHGNHRLIPQTWKLKLSTTKWCRQPSILTTRKLNVS